MIRESVILAVLSASLVRPVVPAVAAWLALRIVRVRHPAVAHQVWTAVLAGMLVIPLVSVMAPAWKIPVTRSASVRSPLAAAFSEEVVSSAPVPATEPAPRRPSAAALILWAYFAGLGAMVCYRVLGIMLVTRFILRSTPLKPRLRESHDLLSPITVGGIRPLVILPAEWRTWGASTRRAVLAHEFAHLRRRDTLVAGAAQLATCLFWFHPLPWWLLRKTSELAELACDAEAVRKTHDPAGYSRILLHFAQVVKGAGYRAALPGLAMSRASGISSRVERIFEFADRPARNLVRPAWALALVGVPVVCVAATVGFGEREAIVPSPAPTAEATVPPVEVQAQPPQQAPNTDYISGGGNAAASETVTIRPLIDGQLATVSFQEGERVQAGQLLATLDPRPYESRVQQARAQMASHEAQLQVAMTNLDRTQQLAKAKIIPEGQLGESMAAMAELQGKVNTDKAAVAAAEIQLNGTRIVSPISGVAGLRLIDPGNFVSAADTKGIVTIAQLQPIAILFQVPEDLVPQVREALRQNPGPLVEVWNRNNSSRLASGRLTAMDNQIDIQTGNAKLKAVCDNKDSTLMPGQYVNVRLYLNRR